MPVNVCLTTIFLWGQEMLLKTVGFFTVCSRPNNTNAPGLGGVIRFLPPSRALQKPFFGHLYTARSSHSTNIGPILLYKLRELHKLKIFSFFFRTLFTHRCCTYLETLFFEKYIVLNGKLSSHTRFNSPSPQNEIITTPLPGVDTTIDDDVWDRKTKRYLILFNTGVDFFFPIKSFNMDGHNFDGLTDIYVSC